MPHKAAAPNVAGSTMREAGIFLMAMASLAAVAMATALPTLPTAPAPTATVTRRSLGRRSRFLAAALAPAPAGLGVGGCSAGSQCPDIIEPINGFPFPGAECCNGVCVDTSFSVQHCGGCDYKCGSWPWICCWGYCFNSQNDFENCGRCGISCKGTCNYGVCDYAV